MQLTLKNNKARIEVVDAIRGLAIILICLVHNLLHYSSNIFPATDTNETRLNALDFHLANLISSYGIGKGYALFALLFGFTFSLQYQSLKIKNGTDFGYRFLWRLVTIFCFGLFNGLLYPADILTSYAILGTILFITRKFTDKVILGIAIFFLLEPLQWLYLLSPSINEMAIQIKQISAEKATLIQETIASGNIIDIMKTNLTTTIIRKTQGLIVNPRMTQTIGLFLVGVLIQQKKLFEPTLSSNQFWIYMLIACSLLIPSINITSEGILNNILEMWQNILFSFVIISSFVLLYQNKKIQHQLSWLAKYGRMSMTNYISQSFLGAFVYYPFGMYLAPKCGTTTSVLIGILMVTLQVQFCKYWLQKHRQGPLESLLGKITRISLIKTRKEDK